MNILLTGATGFIGKHLYKKLSKEGHHIVVLARRSSDTSFIKEGEILIIDQPFDELKQAIQDHEIDGVIHLASLYINQHTVDDIDDLINSNIALGTRVLELAKQLGLRWFINTGTLFQHYQNQEYNPVNLYAATKQAFENIAKYYYETSRLNFVTLKLNDTYGPDDTRKKIFNLWKEYARTGKELKMSPGDQIMEILYINDVVDGFITIINLVSSDDEQAYCGKNFKLPSEERLSLKELFKIFKKVTGYNLDIEWGSLNYRQREVMEPATNVAPLPGWKQKVFFEEGIRIMIKGN